MLSTGTDSNDLGLQHVTTARIGTASTFLLGGGDKDLKRQESLRFALWEGYSRTCLESLRLVNISLSEPRHAPSQPISNTILLDRYIESEHIGQIWLVDFREPVDGIQHPGCKRSLTLQFLVAL